MTTGNAKKGSGSDLRAVDKAAASEAGRALGSISTPKKAEAARKNATLKKTHAGPPPRDPLTLPCTCGKGTDTEIGEGHKTTCPRGRLLWQRARTERLRREARGEA